MRTLLPLAAPALLAGLVGLACGARGAADPGAPQRVVLLELFTSQGCSSCPPADHLLATLCAPAAASRGVVALAFHVDYWNHIGWTDPFSAAAWSERQRRYAEAMPEHRVYTPQLVVDGRDHCVGSDRRCIDRLVAAAAAEPGRATVAVHPRWQGEEARGAAGALTVGVEASRRRDATAPAAEVWVALFEDGLETPVSRGENARRTLRNERVVRRLGRALTLPAGGGDGRVEMRLEIPAGWRPDRLGVVAFVQEPGSLRVLAATEARPAA